MNCKFGTDTCDLSCKKFPICSYYSIQAQISEIQSQIAFIYQSFAQHLNDSEKHENITKEIDSDHREIKKQEDAL